MSEGMYPGSIPPTLTSLSICSFNISVIANASSSEMVELYSHGQLDCSHPGCLPPLLKTLTIGYLSAPLAEAMIPPTLQSLNIIGHMGYKIPDILRTLRRSRFPPHLVTQLTISESFRGNQRMSAQDTALTFIRMARHLSNVAMYGLVIRALSESLFCFTLRPPGGGCRTMLTKWTKHFVFLSLQAGSDSADKSYKFLQSLGHLSSSRLI
ncbi:hypothetical protein SAMD00019534_110140 [Acytostelium subglobosum LB1]|uniref:hypothetical protein n=1 Tax=Acytostelium subglobosum LB1 TaxID=1410327 RepID=UPI000644F038|nr:hypothetical protein SAMD00019534_110140 [Acytostelium subglobosum LB1]GAM27838.1 hypothetical protein SAMD00019534_110140 [Acytostelium subglobosum LB1]|eukprot:XP_012749121.1 hypothetical protein SAMD00019534_110140 [Acytostelium subglobosum LB1]